MTRRTIDFFRELGLELEGGHDRGEWAGRVTDWRSARRDCHDAHAGRPRRLELSRFLTPPAIGITATPP